MSMALDERRLAVTLKSMRRMLEGIVPPALATVTADGMPHVSYLSQAEYVDEHHIALTYQFFNTTRANVLATRRACLAVDDPYSGAGVVMQLEYLRTETEGPVFERLRAKLAGIASQSGMDKVFFLRGADIYRVNELRRVPGRRELPAAEPRCDVAAASRVLSERLAQCDDTAALLDTFMCGLHELLLVEHAMLWMIEPDRPALTLLASRGYEVQGIGAEVMQGEGLVGIVAREGVAVRVGHMTQAVTYGRAARGVADRLGLAGMFTDEIPLPGLPAPGSQLAVPLRMRGSVVGVLFVESRHDQYFSYDDEDGLTLLAGQLALALAVLQPADTPDAAAPAAAAAAAAVRPPPGEPLCLRRYRQDSSVFIDGEYVIKGVAGAILWKLADEYTSKGRTEHTNRELRLAASELRLPDVQDNLEVRLLLLQRRLAERGGPLQIEKTGRGRFRLVVGRPLTLETD